MTTSAATTEEERPAYTAGGLLLPSAATLRADGAFVRRFWEKVAIVPLSPDDCWLWTAATEEKGYGKFKVAGKMCQAHRVAVMLVTGQWPRSDRMILHSCDTPGCCNPAHLREGTALENNRETVMRGRHRWGIAGITYWRGTLPSERILLGNSRFSEWDVREIRRKAKAGESVASLAAHYNVAKTTIRDCVAKRTFAWLITFEDDGKETGHEYMDARQRCYG